MAHPARSLSLVSSGGDVHTTAGTRIPEVEVRTRQIARQAGRWRTFAGDHSRMRPETLDAKALDACAFSVHHGASSLAVPSKIVGTSRHQGALRSLAGDPGATWRALDLAARGDDLVVSAGGRVLGRVQPKHLSWVRPLVPFGLRVYLSRVTGADDDRPRGYRLGCNVAFGHVGDALAALAGTTGGGDGAPSAHDRASLRLVVARGANVQAATAATGVPILPEAESLTGYPDDVVLWRTLEGEAQASVPHVSRHSPTGIEWGYGGSGPADLARSILLTLADRSTADALYQRFKAEVVSAVPEVGGVLRAADVRAWAERARTR